MQDVKYLDRRRFLQALSALPLVCSGVAHAQVGLSAAPDLYQAVSIMPGITEGTGAGTLYVLFTPWCHWTPDIYAASRQCLDKMSFRWIPYSGGQKEGRAGTEKLLSDKNTADIPDAFTKIKIGYQLTTPTPLSDQQDQRMSQIARLIIRDTGHGLSTPSFVYRMQGDRVRVAVGSLSLANMQDIARDIA